MYIGLPIIFLLLTIVSFIWFGITIKRKNISNSTTIKWLVINIVFLVLFVYLFILGVAYEVNKSFDYDSYNFLQWIAVNVLRFDPNQKWAWITIVLTIIAIMSICISISTIIKLNQQNYRINELNRNLAILKGKISLGMNEFNFDTSELSIEELKYLLEEQLAKEKLKAKYKNKLSRLSKSIDVDLHTSTKTLLNLNDKEKNNYDE